MTSWVDDGADVGRLVDALTSFYRQGYGELAIALHMAGWRDHGAGMLDSVVTALHALRPDADSSPLYETRIVVAALHQAVATEPQFGSALRRSAGLTDDAASDSTRHWWVTTVLRSLNLE